MTSDQEEPLSKLFAAIDINKNGYIERQDLNRICSDLDLNDEELDSLFSDLDVDRDGKISKKDFLAGFRGVLAYDEFVTTKPKVANGGGNCPFWADSSLHKCGSMDRPLAGCKGKSGCWNRFLIGTGPNFYCLQEDSQEQVCSLYQALHGTQLPELLGQFEEIVLNVIRDIRQSQFEKERIELSFKRDKESHEQHLRQLEDEMEATMAKVEARVKHELNEKHEAEKEDIEKTMRQEIEDLKNNLKKLQKMEPQIAGTNEHQKQRLEEVLSENRFLASQLTDAQTALALVRSEMATLRQNYEEKCHELESDKETLMQYIKEQDNLARQVHLLHDANKKLHDTNDDLRAALENNKVANKRPHSLYRFEPAFIYVHGVPTTLRSLSTPCSPAFTPPVPRSHSSGADDYVQEYLSQASNTFPKTSGAGSLADELSMIQSSPCRSDRSLTAHDCEVDSIPEDFGTFCSVDSGHSTMQDIHELDVEYEQHEDLHLRPRKMNKVSHNPSMEEDDEFDVNDGQMNFRHHQHDVEMESENDDEEIERMERNRQISRAPSACSQSSSYSRASSSKSVKKRSIRRQLPAIPQKPITSEPERMYKIVLCGDAAVGKSSFIMRLCKNKFVNNLNSTLGVDFQTKVLEVDGRVIALQLWDTAGQERFRSIAKSYFRRADGVLLLYDVTYERSFLNIREWVDAVEDGAQKKIPMMIVGNKLDLREEREEKGKKCVAFDDGHRLAREYDAMFIETSAKDGDYVMDSASEFARLLMKQEDMEVNSVGIKLQVKEEKKKDSTCCSM